MDKSKNKRSFLSQSEIISYVLVGLLVVGVSLSLYEWGIPIIQKNNISNQIISLQQQIVSLANYIQNIGLNGGQTSLQLQIQSGSLSVTDGEISYTTSITGSSNIVFYNPYLREIPINYNLYLPCIYNTTLNISSSQPINVCDAPGLYAYINTTSNEIVINDSLYNGLLELPIGNYNDVITSAYTFDIEDQGNQIVFVPLYPTGIYGNSNYPSCIVYATQTSNIFQYTIECRPLYDPKTGLCYWIYIQPSGQSSLTRSGIATISQQGVNIINSPESTICKAIEQISVDVSL